MQFKSISSKIYGAIAHRLFVIVLMVPFFLSCSAKINGQRSLEPSTTFIVIPDKADNLETKAALLLSKWLKNIYRVDSGFEVRPENKFNKTAGDIISIGNTRFVNNTTLDSRKPYSFRIIRKNAITSIVGRNTVRNTTWYILFSGSLLWNPFLFTG